MVESMRYVRAYPAELPVLRDLLPQIQTPVQMLTCCSGCRRLGLPVLRTLPDGSYLSEVASRKARSSGFKVPLEAAG